MSYEQQKPSKRLTSLDVFRGIAITGMILVNMVGVADKVYFPLLHSDWNGCTPADLVFPFFLFIVGVGMAVSLSTYTDPAVDSPLTKDDWVGLYWRIVRRSVILFALGLLLNGFWDYDWNTIRIMVVLQRISLTYLLTA